jgi:hypothetical protein
VGIERHHQQISGEFGFLRNNSVGGSTGGGYYIAGGFRYGLTVGRMLFVKRANAQDSITLEGGAFIYKILAENNDAYTVVSFIPTLRYNIVLSDNFGIFFYGGAMINRVAAATNATDAGLESLTSILPAGGGGLIFQLGPNWDVRVDAGIDMLSAGLMLRF